MSITGIHTRRAPWRAALAVVAAVTLGAGLFATVPAASATPAANPGGQPGASADHLSQSTSHFKGVNWADPRDNFANDPVVPSGLSTSDDYATTYAKAASILRSFRRTTGANTVRLPINPYSVGTPWWNSYKGAIDAATHSGFKVILAYWEGTGSFKDGVVDDPSAFWSMWSTVTDTYGSNSHVYFEPMNEPHGYSLTGWTDLASQWLASYPAVPRNRVIVDGSGYADSVTGVCADTRLDGTYLALHDYGYWGNHTYQGWVDDIRARIGSCASRTIVDEFGSPMTTGLNYNGSSTTGDSESNNYVAYLQAMTDTLRALDMGSVYWPGLRTGDTYSLTTLTGTGTDLSLLLNNRSGLDRIAWGWGNRK